jgi:hypothetical protein
VLDPVLDWVEVPVELAVLERVLVGVELSDPVAVELTELVAVIEPVLDTVVLGVLLWLEVGVELAVLVWVVLGVLCLQSANPPVKYCCTAESIESITEHVDVEAT